MSAPAAPQGTDPATAFAVFTEIGIIAQLSAAAFEAALPGWTVGQFGVIQHLIRRGDGKTPLDLARAFQQPKTTMTHTLQVLERRGLIELRPNPADGRSKLVYLRPEGRDWYARALPGVGQTQAALLARLDPGTMAALLPHLRHLREVMDALRD